jgi:Circadian oscillating protein COP23
MKNIFKIALILLISPALLTIPSAAEQPDVKFYCAPDQGMLPTTYVRKTGMEEQLALITWKYAVPKGMTNQQRCDIVSRKFQSIWEQKKFAKLMIGKDDNGWGLICALSYRDKKCDRSKALFTLSKTSDAQEIIEKLQGKMSGKVSGPPIYQGSDRNAIDFNKLIQKFVSNKN